MRILLGENGDTGEEICLEPDWFRTHMHLIGSTGAGKTSAIHTILQSLMLQTRSEQCCLFVVDPMGNLSHDLLRFISDEKFCPQHVRERLVYFEPARGDVVSPFN